jgi:hypothetical protein
LTRATAKSNVYMSIMFYVQDDLPLTRRQAWGRLFGICHPANPIESEAGSPDPAVPKGKGSGTALR